MQIEFQKISKKYKNGVWGIKDVNLTIGSGVFGLLGPNGAGKTTLMRLLATLIKPTYGACLVNERNIFENSNEIRSMIGYLPQDLSMYGNLTAFEFVDYIARIKGIKSKKEIKRVLEDVGLLEAQKQKISSLSGGMKRRVGIAQAIVGSPMILIVDEPTAGLDPEERVRFRNLISKFAKNRTTILSTHIIEDIYQTCDNIAIFKSSRVVYNGSKLGLMKQISGKVKVIRANSEQELDEIRDKAKIISVSYESDSIKVRIIDENNYYDKEPEKESLEDSYIYCVGVV